MIKSLNRKNLIKGLKDPKKAYKTLQFAIKNRFKKRKGVLFFLGADPNGTFNLIYKNFEKSYVFEANPDRYDKLIKKYGKYKNIYIYNVALADYDGEITFNISNNNNGASSSVGNFKDDWNHEYQSEKIKMVKSIKVSCINLNSFIKKNNINFIDEYCSDIQGMDLTVLKTIKPLIQNRKIKNITCEVTKNNKKNIYHDLPDNSEEGFHMLLDENYTLKARGWGILIDNIIEDIPEDSWEMDCKWTLKDDKSNAII